MVDRGARVRRRRGRVRVGVRVRHRDRRRVGPVPARRHPGRHGARRRRDGDPGPDRRGAQGDGDRAPQPHADGRPRRSRSVSSTVSCPTRSCWPSRGRSPATLAAGATLALAETKRMIWEGLGVDRRRPPGRGVPRRVAPVRHGRRPRGPGRRDRQAAQARSSIRALTDRPSTGTQLIRDDRVHGSLYTDPAVWARPSSSTSGTARGSTSATSARSPDAERLRAQVDRPAAGDHDPRSRWRGPPAAQPLHRTGPTRCATSRAGTRTTFRCPYHGWTFANTGALLGYPFSSGYGGRERKADLGLADRAARRARSTGSCSAPSRRRVRRSREHLGPAADAFDRLVRLSPTGEIELTAGGCSTRCKANWKMLRRERDRRLPPAVRALVDLRRGRQRHRRPLRRALDGRRPAISATATPRTTCARSSAASASRSGGSGPVPRRSPTTSPR